MNVSMFYFGEMFTFFGLHMEDERLVSISFLHEGAPNLWYVLPLIYLYNVDKCVHRHLYNTNFIKDLDGVRPLVEGNSTFSTGRSPRTPIIVASTPECSCTRLEHLP